MGVIEKIIIEPKEQCTMIFFVGLNTEIDYIFNNEGAKSISGRGCFRRYGVLCCFRCFLFPFTKEVRYARLNKCFNFFIINHIYQLRSDKFAI